MSIDLSDYVDVAERVREFYAKYPDGSLRCGGWDIRELPSGTFFIYRALAYRTPNDPCPAEGVAWEPVPGKTPYTEDSEAMNAETSAWGRAIAALGIATSRGIASSNEVRSRSGNGQGEAEATAPQKRAVTTILNKAQVSAEDQRAVVHALAGNPPTKQGMSAILDVLNDDANSLEANVATLFVKADSDATADAEIPA